VAAELLPVGAASDDVVMYLVKYMTKDPVPPAQTLTALQGAAQTAAHVRQFPYVADDSGTAARTSAHTITRLCNRKNVAETSDTWRRCA
jgi:hypothetical protein